MSGTFGSSIYEAGSLPEVLGDDGEPDGSLPEGDPRPAFQYSSISICECYCKDQSTSEESTGEDVAISACGKEISASWHQVGQSMHRQPCTIDPLVSRWPISACLFGYRRAVKSFLLDLCGKSFDKKGSCSKSRSRTFRYFGWLRFFTFKTLEDSPGEKVKSKKSFAVRKKLFTEKALSKKARTEKALSEKARTETD